MTEAFLPQPDNEVEGGSLPEDPSVDPVVFRVRFDKKTKRFSMRLSDDECSGFSDLIREISDVPEDSRQEFIDAALDFLGSRFDAFIRGFREIDRLSLDEVDARMQQLYIILGEAPEGEMTDWCIAKISELEEVIFEAFSDGRVNVGDFIGEKIDELKTREEYAASVDAEHDGRLIDLALQTFVLDGDIQMEEIDGEKVYFKEHEGERWLFELAFDIDFGPICIFICSENDPRKFISLPLWSYDDADEGLNDYSLTYIVDNDEFGKVTDMANRNYELEQANQERLTSYDLPHDDPIQYLRVYPKRYDPTLAETLHSSSVLAYTLQSRYPNLEVEPPIFANSPEDRMEDSIRAAYEDGVRYFYLDIYSHGSPTGFDSFKDGSENFDVHIGLTELSAEFPDAHFHIDTIACFGAGLRDEFLAEFKAGSIPEESVSLFLQTKPEMPNILGLTSLAIAPDEDIEAYSSYYYLYFIEGLNSGKTFGEAAFYANNKAKETFSLDAEAVIGGNLIAMIDSKEEELPFGFA